jgi:carbon starvation protein
MNGFVIGCSSFLKGLGFTQIFSQTMISVLIISFAATSLDTATRIQRYVISEIGEINKIEFLKSPLISAAIAVLSALFLMLIQDGGKGGLLIWPLFGAANQMLGSLTLIIICIFLIRAKRNPKPYLIPLLFVFTITSWGLLINIIEFIKDNNYLLTTLSILFLITQLWIALETWSVFNKRTLIKNI